MTVKRGCFIKKFEGFLLLMQETLNLSEDYE